MANFGLLNLVVCAPGEPITLYKALYIRSARLPLLPPGQGRPGLAAGGGRGGLPRVGGGEQHVQGRPLLPAGQVVVIAQG